MIRTRLHAWLLAACVWPAFAAATPPPAPPPTDARAEAPPGPPDGRRHERDRRHDEDGRGRHHRFRDHFPPGPPVIPPGVVVPDWAALTPAQQAALGHVRDAWDQMPASRRVHALERVERRARWEAMTPEQRQTLRDGARNFRDLPPELREKMRASLHATRALPDAERRRLFERWHALTPEQRRAWLEAGGPGISPEP